MQKSLTIFDTDILVCYVLDQANGQKRPIKTKQKTKIVYI